jgi:hypothetical protein
MKRYLLISFVIILAGCSTCRMPSSKLDAATAKAALLSLMQSSVSPFDGADPKRFEKVELEDEGKGIYRWGAFTINLRKKTYNADVVGEYVASFYSGKFVKDGSGLWIAKNLSKMYADKLGPAN